MSDQTPERAAATDGNRPAPPAVTQEGERNLFAKMHVLEAERAHLAEKVLALRTEQQHLLERYVELEEQNSTLTTLYVACQRLHSSLERAEVLHTVREIIANLVGCEEYVLFSLAPDGWLHRLDSFGVNAEAYARVSPGYGLIGRAVETGEAYLLQESCRSTPTQTDAHLTACIPLKRNGAVTGAIALFRLLPQRSELQELDRELFRLLETHLATALYCSEPQQWVNTRSGVSA